jgi:nucleoside-diphosphate-sugar epimerase
VNVASGHPVRIGDLVAQIAAEVGVRADVDFCQEAPSDSDPAVLLADVSRLRSLQWSRAVDLRSGVALTVEWWRKRLSC